MRMIGKIVSLVALVSTLTLSPASAQTPIAFDGQYLPSRVKVNYEFDCRESRTKIAYLQLRRPLGSVGRDPQRALSVTLLDFTVTGRALPRASRVEVAALFRRLAWVEDISAECFRDIVTVAVRGMPLIPWAEFVMEKSPSRPRAELWTVEVGAKGKVTIR